MKKVVKFGGSSLASAEQFRKVGEIIRSDEGRRYVVPSALLTADAVRDILIDAQNLIIGGNEIKVLHMEPVLLPIVVNEKKMELTPVWEIEERINYVELGVQDYRTVHFDGSTGQEII